MLYIDNRKESDMKTDEEYIKSFTRCPLCDSSDLIADGNIDCDGLDAWADVKCLSCREQWTDHYTLTGYHYEKE